MYNTGWPKLHVLLTAFLQLWLKFRAGIDKYRIVPVRKLFYFHHCALCKEILDNIKLITGF